MAHPVLRHLAAARPARALACALAVLLAASNGDSAWAGTAHGISRNCAALRAVPPQPLRVAQARAVSNPPGIVTVVGALVPGADSACTVAFGSGGTPRDAAERQFEIGSVTKVFTALLLADMVRRGEARLDDPVARYLPFTFDGPKRCAHPMTLLDLATHYSGLPRLPDDLHAADPADPYASFDRRDLYRYLSHYEFGTCPGARYEYSNLGTALLGHVLALRLGTTYERALQTRILDPLALRHTGWSSREANRVPDTLVDGHDGDGGRVAHWNYDVLSPAGGLRSTVGDLLVLAAACLPGARGVVADDCRIARVPRRAADGDRIGLIFSTDARDRTVWKGGRTAGFAAFLGVQPDARTAVVIVANEALDVDDVGLALLAPARAASLPMPRAVALPRSLLARYAGVYHFTPNTIATVHEDGRGLVATMTAVPQFRLYPTSRTHFVVRKFGSLFSFDFTTARNREGLVLHQAGADAVAWKTAATAPRGSTAER